jgi:Ca2+-transporting ATPase
MTEFENLKIKHMNIKGLTESEVAAARTKFGSNSLEFKRQNAVLKFLFDLVKEPMILLLLAATCIYAFNGDYTDSIFLGLAIVLVATISGIQERKSRRALDAIKKLSTPHCKVIRNGQEQIIDSALLVVGDMAVLEEGVLVAADGQIISAHDFSVDESMLSGESMQVYKSSDAAEPFVYKGTIVTGGRAIVQVTATGNRTRLGAIGKSIEQIQESQSPLELSIRNFVKKMAFIGLAVFVAVWGINYFREPDLAGSLLKSLTLAMSILPEEIPVAFTSFMALAAFRLIKKGIVVKQMKMVETLGSATVICTDKTGTITQNKMTLTAVYSLESGIKDCNEPLAAAEKELVRIAMWASEPSPFDPMEIALHEAYEQAFSEDERKHYTLIHEYPLGGKPPMMTHIFEHTNGERIIAAKGAPEAMIAVSQLSREQGDQVAQAMNQLAEKGWRILGVGKAAYTGERFPENQQDFSFTFCGLVAFSDPPKEHIDQVLQDFYKAGIEVKIITGDNATTTRAIAQSIGFEGDLKSVDGVEIMKMDNASLEKCVQQTQLFTRMYPEAKLKVIEALKRQGAIVAMTGDGINDGPALKAAHIGIAMGNKGTEIAREAAGLILLNDDLRGMVDAVAMGRKIYANLKKAIQYIISIHLPIILTVFIPLALGLMYPNILSPVHVIFLELIMGPTCSIIYENEPIEPNAMQQPPRRYNTTFFNLRELTLSIIQGLVISLAVMLAYYYGTGNGYDEAGTRSLVFIVLISANIMLTLVNRSFYYSIFVTIRYANNLIPIILLLTSVLTIAMFAVPFLRNLFELKMLSSFDFTASVLLGFASALWLEIWKWARRRKNNTTAAAISGSSR